METNKNRNSDRVHKKLAMLLSAVAIFSTSVEASQRRILKAPAVAWSNIDVNTGRGLRLGLGYDSFKDDSTGICVKFPSGVYDENRLEDTNFENTFKLELIESKYDLAKKMGITASASIKSGWGKGSATASYLDEQKINKYSIYILVSNEVLIPSQTIQDELLDEDYKDLAISHPEAFRQKCGNEFVASIQRGGVLYGLLRLDTEDSNSFNQIKTSLRAKVGTFKAAVDFERSILEITQKKNFQIFFHQIGGQTRQNPTSIEELLERARQFPIEVSKRPIPIKAVTAPYYQLKNFPIGPTPFETSVQESVIEDLSRTRFKLTDEKNNIEYILENSKQFAQFNANDLLDRVEYLNQKINGVNVATKKCFANYDRCHFPEDLRLVAFELPQRMSIGSADFQCKIRTHEECGYVYKTLRSPACGVEAYNEQRDAICGVEEFNTAETEICGVETYKQSIGAVCGVERYKEGKGGPCGYEDMCWALRKSPGGGDGCRSLPKTCRDPKFGIESYASCRHESFGVEKYKACSDPSHGPKTFKMCRSPKFGVASYKECEHISHGVVAVKQCKLFESVEQNTGILKYSRCE